MIWKKKIKIAALTMLGTFILMFAALVVHIVFMVKGRKPPENATIQMARADFDKSIDKQSVQEISVRIKKMAGVKETYYNPGSAILIYTFDAQKNNAARIFNDAIKTFGFAAKMKTFSKDENTKGCPVIDNQSFYGRLTVFIDKCVN